MKIYSHEYAWSDMGDQYRQAHEVPAYPEGFREDTATLICLPEDQIWP